MMRKKFLNSFALASMLMLGACSSSDDLSGGSTAGNVGKSYIAVKINSVGSAPGSRADYSQGGGTYDDGTDAEGAISEVRFFFFNNDGSAYLIKGSSSNYKDVQPDPTEAGSADHLQTIEGKTAAVMMIEGETKTAPAYVIAVVNPKTMSKLEDRAYRESELRDAFVASKFIDDNGKNFVMSNSVYSENGARVCATSISGHVAENAEAAKANPADIYVERVVAKATTSVDESTGTWEKIPDGKADAGKYRTKVGEINVVERQPDGNDQDIKKDVYAVVEGWGLADEDGQADLVKQIDVTSDKWTSAILGIDPWTSPDYHRCFWSSSVAITTESGTNPIKNHKYSEYTTSFGTTPLYTCPNTPTYNEFQAGINKNENQLTKVLVAAKLEYEDADGNPQPAVICKYRGMEFLGEDKLKTQIAEDHKTYFTVDAADPQKHITLTAANITFTRTSLVGEDQLKSYEVRPVLADGVKVYQQDGAGNWVDKTTELNQALAESPAQVRKEGMTYYYTPIRHLGTDETKWGYYGVVRNHSYRITINTIAGFGTPVYNPDEIIDPTIPKDTDTYLAARVNVLSWRVVTNKVDLDATK